MRPHLHAVTGGHPARSLARLSRMPERCQVDLPNAQANPVTGHPRVVTGHPRVMEVRQSAAPKGNHTRPLPMIPADRRCIWNPQGRWEPSWMGIRKTTISARSDNRRANPGTTAHRSATSHIPGERDIGWPHQGHADVPVTRDHRRIVSINAGSPRADCVDREGITPSRQSRPFHPRKFPKRRQSGSAHRRA